jgi:hypothetical protein
MFIAYATITSLDPTLDPIFQSLTTKLTLDPTRWSKVMSKVLATL